VRVKVTAKRTCLFLFTSLVVAYVRHDGVTDQWRTYPSLGNLLISWFIHSVGLFFFFVAAAFLIERYHKFFLGREWQGDHDDLQYYVVMTVLVAAIAIFAFAHWVPIGADDYD